MIIAKRQNPLEFVFEDISTFDAKNPIVGSLLRELAVGKKDIASDLIKRAPGLDTTLRYRLNKLKNIQEPKDDDNNLSPPPSPPPPSFSQRPQSGPSPPPFQPPQQPSGSSNFIPIPPAPSAPPLPPEDYYSLLGEQLEIPSNKL